MDEHWTVHKFGGSVLRGAPDLDRLADRVSESAGRNALVVSALWGTTDRLLRAVDDPAYADRLVADLRAHHLMFAPRLATGRDSERFERVLSSMGHALEARRANPTDQRARTQLLATGERLSALVVAHHLRRCGFDAHAVGAEDIGLVLKGRGEAEAVDLPASESSFDRNALHGTPVITGWLGSGEDGALALLGRGGSDHTATAIAHLLRAHRVILWKDVEGIHPINPRWGLTTAPIRYMTYEHAQMAAAIDATVLHPATVGPCITEGIPIEVRRLHEDTRGPAGTIIGPGVHADQGPMAASCTLDVMTMQVTHPPSITPGASTANVLSRLASKGIGVHASTQWPDGARLIIDAPRLEEAAEVIRAAGSSIVDVGEASALITVLGSWAAPEEAAALLGSATGSEPVDAEALRLRFLVPRANVRDALGRLIASASWTVDVT
jgi:aspartate kinase